MKKTIILLSLLLFLNISIYSNNINKYSFHCDKDTIKIEKLLQEGIAYNEKESNKLMTFFGKKLLNSPYVAHTLENNNTEKVVINIDETDCTILIETLIALTKTTQEGNSDWKSYAQNLEKIRYRNGRLDGYTSRLHYISDWIIDNTNKNILEEITSNYNCKATTKDINFMTVHADKYIQLQNNDSNISKLQEIEDKYKSHTYYIIEKSDISDKTMRNIKSGDIIAFTTNIAGLDVTHMAMAYRIANGELHVIHASLNKGKVIIDSRRLDVMTNDTKSNTGIRVIRLK